MAEIAACRRIGPALSPCGDSKVKIRSSPSRRQFRSEQDDAQFQQSTSRVRWQDTVIAASRLIRMATASNPTPAEIATMPADTNWILSVASVFMHENKLFISEATVPPGAPELVVPAITRLHRRERQEHPLLDVLPQRLPGPVTIALNPSPDDERRIDRRTSFRFSFRPCE